MGIHTGRLQSLFSRERRAGDAAARDWRKGKFPSFSPVPRGRASRDTGQPTIISWVCQRPCILNVPLACEGTPCPVWFKKSLHQISMGYRCEKSHWPFLFLKEPRPSLSQVRNFESFNLHSVIGWHLDSSVSWGPLLRENTKTPWYRDLVTHWSGRTRVDQLVFSVTAQLDTYLPTVSSFRFNERFYTYRCCNQSTYGVWFLRPGFLANECNPLHFSSVIPLVSCCSSCKRK